MKDLLERIVKLACEEYADEDVSVSDCIDKFCEALAEECKAHAIYSIGFRGWNSFISYSRQDQTI